MMQCDMLYQTCLQGSDVFGDPKPKEDVPESLIPEPDPTLKSRTRTNPEVCSLNTSLLQGFDKYRGFSINAGSVNMVSLNTNFQKNCKKVVR